LAGLGKENKNRKEKEIKRIKECWVVYFQVTLGGKAKTLTTRTGLEMKQDCNQRQKLRLQAQKCC